MYGTYGTAILLITGIQARKQTNKLYTVSSTSYHCTAWETIHLFFQIL